MSQVLCSTIILEFLQVFKIKLSFLCMTLSSLYIYGICGSPPRQQWCYAFLFLQLRLMWSSQEWKKHERAYLQYIYYKVKPRIQRELSHTIKARCACVWMYMVANLILLCSLKTYLALKTWKQLCKKIWDILFISSFFFLGGHRSTHYFQYLKHLSIFFNTFSLNN